MIDLVKDTYIRVISVRHRKDFFQTIKYFGHFERQDDKYLYLKMIDRTAKIPLKSIKEIQNAKKR